jgi:DNA-binding CsgD family transcriptional regulator
MLSPSDHPRIEALPESGRAVFALTPREREMLTLLAAGMTAVEIAEQLVISRETVKSHVRSAMLKLGARTRTHAVVRALSCGEIAPLYSGVPSEPSAIVANGGPGRARPSRTAHQPVRAKR